jgi:hypothetical protein
MNHVNAAAPDNAQKAVNYLSQMALEACSSGLVGYFMARVFTHINPIHGAVFCAISVPVSRVVDLAMEKIFNRNGASDESKVIGKVLSFAISTAISAGVATAIGFPLTFQASLIMGVALFAGWCLVEINLAAFRALTR